ncbi:MAG: helix-turn-helix domain-containing protein [Gammaproteobacteria bacterium]
MAKQQDRVTEQRPLEILGISEAEERAYRWLLTHSGATVVEITQALALSAGKTQRLLDTIETKGLVTHAPERPRRYIPVSPDIALKTLSIRHQEDLQRAEGVIRELQEQAATQRHDEQEQMVELIASHEVQRQIFEHMHQTAQYEVATLIRLPILISRLDVPSEQGQDSQRKAQARGVHYRSVVDTDWLSSPGAVQATREDMRAGEEIRVVSHLPFKMALVDHRLAFVPLNIQRLDSPILLIRSSTLLDALYALFEILWERAAPISITRAGIKEMGNPGSQLPEGTENILSLMAAGLNDKSIAYELGISTRTLNRRIAEIMKVFGARTRFQMVWLVALRLTDTHLDPTLKRLGGEIHRKV